MIIISEFCLDDKKKAEGNGLGILIGVRGVLVFDKLIRQSKAPCPPTVNV